MSGDPVAILCSGQGGQHRDMFAWLGDVPEAEPVFAAAAAVLGGVDPRRFVLDAEDDVLFSNFAGQILCCTQALAAWAMLSVTRPPRIVLAGYSVGELAAWGCAGVFTPEHVLKLAATRAKLMDEAAPPDAGLAAIVGLPRSVLDEILHSHDAFVAIASGADSFTIGGSTAAIAACLDAASRKGASVTRRLRVAVPSHTTLLTTAADHFADMLASCPREAPIDGIRLLSGIDGDAVRNVRDGVRKLAKQISTTIEWWSCIEACVEFGATRFLELGPGVVLARMVERSLSGLSARGIDEFRTPDGVRSWLGRAAG